MTVQQLSEDVSPNPKYLLCSLKAKPLIMVVYLNFCLLKIVLYQPLDINDLNLNIATPVI